MGDNEIKIARLETRVDQIEKDAAEIKSLTEAVIKLTFIVDELKREKEDRVPCPEVTPNFWNTKAGQLVPICMAATACVGLLCIAGQRVADVVQTLPNIK